MIVTRQMAERAAATLGLELAVADAAMVQNRYRKRAMVLHPDKGGDAAAFVEADKAKCVLLAWLARPRAQETVDVSISSTTCPMCKGGGKRTLRRGFRTMTMVCGTCRGLGELVRQEKVEE